MKLFISKVPPESVDQIVTYLLQIADRSDEVNDYYSVFGSSELSGEDQDLFVDTRDNKHFKSVANDFVALIDGVVDLRREQAR